MNIDILKQFDMTRDTLLKSIQSVTESDADRMPDGFNNTIRWHIGHILFAGNLSFVKARGVSHLSAQYIEWFKGGSSPKEWAGGLPTLEELRSVLREQQYEIRETFAGSLDEMLDPPLRVNVYGGHEFVSVGELINFIIFHESMHLGFINAFQRIISADR